MASAKSPKPTPEVTIWDETRLNLALNDIQKLQDQINALRLTLPRLRKQTSQPAPDKVVFFARFRDKVTTSGQDLESFRKTWFDERYREIFDYAEKREEQDPELWPAIQVLQSERAGDGVGTPVTSSRRDQAESVQQVMERWKSAHPEVKAEITEGGTRMKIVIECKPHTLAFEITASPGAVGKDKIDIVCNTDAVFKEQIDKCIATRPSSDSMQYALDMVAAYSDLGSLVPCSKCQRPLDRHGNLTCARRLESFKEKETASSHKWVALHQSCLPDSEQALLK